MSFLIPSFSHNNPSGKGPSLLTTNQSELESITLLYLIYLFFPSSSSFSCSLTVLFPTHWPLTVNMQIGEQCPADYLSEKPDTGLLKGATHTREHTSSSLAEDRDQSAREKRLDLDAPKKTDTDKHAFRDDFASDSCAARVC